jgi:2,3-diketo-5-methylthio-1-phosphopentane phosphatase
VSVGALLADFDGTACACDVTSAVCERFSAPGWRALDDAVISGELTLKAAIDRQASLLRGSLREMLTFVLGRFAVDPSFIELVGWARDEGIAVTVVSDGFGFHIDPLLRAAGLAGLPVLTNHLVDGPESLRLEHPFAHPCCVGCGTCKMQAVLNARAARSAVAFVGEGQSDRFAAAYADVVFAKDRLAALCRAAGVAFLPWQDFRDVRECLVARGADSAFVPPDIPARCPGWTPAPATEDACPRAYSGVQASRDRRQKCGPLGTPPRVQPPRNTREDRRARGEELSG